MKRRFSRGWGADQANSATPDSETTDDSFELDFDDEAPPADLAGGDPIVITVSPAEADRRLDTILVSRFSQYSRSQFARLAKDGLIMVDGKPAKASLAVTAGRVISCSQPKAPLTDMIPDDSVSINAIYEDEHILVVDKPWGLVVHPAPGHHGPTLAAGLLARNLALSEVGERFRPGLVHRLDKDPSGLLVTAKTETALRVLAESFSQRETSKSYLAFVKGIPKTKAGLLDKPIGRHQTQRHKMAVGQGREARTIYRVIRRFPSVGISLVLLKLITGRTHQARVHLASLGTPVLADPVYSRGISDIVKKYPSLETHLKRQMLHARRLTIAHPATGQLTTFRSPWPEDFLCLLTALLALEKQLPVI